MQSTPPVKGQPTTHGTRRPKTPEHLGTRNPDARNQNKGQPAPVTKMNSRPAKTQTSVPSSNTYTPDEKDNTITLVETNHDANGDGKEKQQSESKENINVAHKIRKRIRKKQRNHHSNSQCERPQRENQKPRISPTNGKNHNSPNHRNNDEERRTNINKRIQMGRQTQRKQQRRRSRNPSIRENSAKHHRGQLQRRIWKLRN